MKLYIFFFLALIALTSTFVEAGRGQEFISGVKNMFSSAKNKLKEGAETLQNVSELGCPFIEKWCEDHCTSKKSLGKCENFECACMKMPESEKEKSEKGKSKKSRGRKGK
uniref:CSab-Iso-5 n=1 Tax=Isometroides vescus TaxID=1330405 RepID=T1E6Y1_9SCOR